MVHNNLTVCKHMTDVKWLVLHNNIWNHFTVCKQCYLETICLQIIYVNIYIYKQDLELNILPGLICH